MDRHSLMQTLITVVAKAIYRVRELIKNFAHENLISGDICISEKHLAPF